MTTEKLVQIRKDLLKFCKKHELKDATFAALDENNKLIGCWDVDKTKSTFDSLVKCFGVCARLYQSSREKLLGIFDDMTRN